jgi:transposase
VLSARIEQVIAPYAAKVALLDTIPGIDRRAAEIIVAEIGPDMGQSPTNATSVSSSANSSSWATRSP